MDLNLSSPKSQLNSRLRAVDIWRGLTLLLMVEAHIPQSIGWISNYSGIVAAPFFLIISGFSYDLFLSSRIKTEVKKYIFLESIFRDFFVYTIPLVPYIVLGIIVIYHSPFLIGKEYEIDIFHWGVFQIIGVGYLFGLLIPNNLKSKVLITASTFIIAYIITNFVQEIPYILMTGPFPLFPWIGYFFVGRVAYDLYKNDYLINDTALLSFSVMLLIISLSMFEILKEEFDRSTRDQFPMFLVLFSISFVIFSLLVKYIDHKHTYLSLADPLEKIGKICFTAYYIHLLLIFTIQKSASIFFNHFPPVITNSVIFVIITIILIQIEKYWRSYDYMLGFEWLIRKGTGKMLKLCRIYL